MDLYDVMWIFNVLSAIIGIIKWSDKRVIKSDISPLENILRIFKNIILRIYEFILYL